MTEFHFEDLDLKDSTLEMGFPSCAIEKDNFTDSQGKQIRTEKNSLFKPKFGNKGHICVLVAVAVLGPRCQRSLICLVGNGSME